MLVNGRAAEAEGNVREAMVRYEAAVKVAPDQAGARLPLGILCHRLGDYTRARAVLDEARRLDPNNAEVSFRLGLTLDALGLRTEAREAYTRTMMLAPSAWQTWFLIGRDHRQLGHAEVARLAYRRGLGQAPDEPDLLSELGSLLWEMGMHDDAYALIEQAAAACPVDPGIRLQLALADLERADLMAAQRNLTLAKHLDPGNRRIDRALEDLALARKQRPHKKRAA